MNHSEAQRLIGKYTLFEQHVFFYSMMMSGILIIASSTFGFGMNTFSPSVYMLINFLWYIFLGTVIFYTPLLYRLLFSRFVNSTKYEAEIKAMLSKIEDPHDKTVLEDYFANNGKLSPNKKQNYALAIIFCILLMDLFILHAWTVGSDRHLVWKPDWVQSIINFVHAHLDLPPLSKNDGFFILNLDNSYLKRHYANEAVLVASPLADSGFLYHMWRVITIIPLLVCIKIIIWKALDWLGATQVNPKNITGVRSFIWSSLATLIMVFMMLVTPFAYLMGTTFMSLPVMYSPGTWAEQTAMELLAFANVILGIKLTLGWFSFWKRVFSKH